MVPRTSLSVSLAISVLSLAACGGGGGNYRIPADHPIKPFEKPEREELIQTEEDAWDIDYDEVEEEGEEESVAGGSEAEPSDAGAGKIELGEHKGELDKNVIRRYIRRKLAQFKLCYERQLLKDPKLAGTVVTKFVIGEEGEVVAVEASGMGNAKVEECVAGVVRSIKFPKPEGGKVSVQYPFNFHNND